MTTLGGLVGSPQRGVTVYSPSRNSPTARQVDAQRFTKKPVKKGERPAVPDSVDARFLASPDEVAQRQQVKAAQNKPWWQDVLGVAGDVLSPLSVPAKLVNVGLEEGVKLLPDSVEKWMYKPFGDNDTLNSLAPLLGGVFGMDPAKTHDKQGVLERLAPRSTYGAGEIYGNDINVPGLTGLRNLGLDILHDPLTYLTAGAGKGVELGAQAAKEASVARTALEAAPKFLDEAGDVVNPAIRDLEATLARAERKAAKLGDKVKIKDIPHSRQGRMGMVSELALSGPEGEAITKQFANEFSKGIDQGFTQMSTEARDALGITKSGLRVRGTSKVIPGTEKLAEVMNLPGKAARAGFGQLGDTLSESSLKSLQKLGEGRTPLGMGEFYKTVRSKSASADEKFMALARIHAETLAHTTQNMVEGGARTAANQSAKPIIKLNEAGRHALVTASEVDPNDFTPLNDAVQKVATVYADLTGRPISDVVKRTPETYVPHIHTGEWYDFAKSMNPEAQEDLRNLTGFTTKDTLQTSGHMDKRMLTLDGAASKDFKIGDRMVHVTDDSVHGLNDAFAQAFPEFKGKVYEDDPLKIIEGYIKAVSQDSRVWSLNKLGGQGTSLATTMTGALDTERQAMNEALASQSREARLAEGANLPRAEGQRAPAIPDQPIVPGSPRDQVNRAFHEQLPEMQARAVTPDQQAQLAEMAGTIPQPVLPEPSSGMFRKVESPVAQERLAEQLLSPEAQATEAALRTEGVATAEAAQQTLGDLRTNMFKDIRKEGKTVGRLLDRIDTSLQKYKRQLEGFRSIRSNNPAEIERMVEATSKNVIDLEAELKQKTATWKGLGTKAANKAERRLKDQLEQLKQIRDEATQHLSEATGERISAEVTKRTETLLAPLRAAEERLVAKTAEIVAPFKQKALDDAADVLERAGLTDEHWQAYSEALAARPRNTRLTTKAGRVAVTEQRALDMAAYRATGGEVTPYIEAQGRATALENMIPDAPPTQAPRLRRELAEINKEFAPGGKHFEEFKARSVMAQQLEHEQAVKAATARERASVEQIRQNIATRSEATIRGPEGERIMDDVTGLETEGGRRVSKLKPGEKAGPRTEREAVASLEAQLQPGSPAHAAEVERTTKAVEDFEAAMPTMTGEVRAAALRDIGASADTVLGPISSELKTMQSITTDLGNKQQLLARRQVNDALVKRMEAAAVGKTDLPAELLVKARELQLVARQNPHLDDLSLAATESLLHNEMEQLTLAAEKVSYARELAAAQAAARKGDLPKIMVATLHDGWVTLHGGLVKTGDTIIDKQLYDSFMRVTEAVNDPKLFTRTFNNLTNLWKTFATLSPGFHVRNALGGIFMNLSDGVGFKHQLEAIDLFRQMRAGGTEWLAEQPERIQQAVKAMWASGAGGQFEESGMRSGLANGRLPRLSRKAGEWVEGPLRLAMGLHSYDQGDTLLQTYERINRIHFDYSRISKMDESMKRIVPFWTFMSRNLPMQITQMATKPRWYSYYAHFKNNFAVPADPLTPDYWGRLGAWNTGKTFRGMPLYLDPDFGFNRIESDIGSIVDAVAGGNPGALLTNANPLIAAPLDFLMKRDSFYDKSFKDTDYSKQEGVTGAFVKALAHLVPGQTNEAGQVSDNFTNLISSLIPLYDRTVRLSGQKDPQRTPESWARFFGAPVRTLSDKQKQSAALGKYLDAKAEATRRRAMQREATG